MYYFPVVSGSATNLRVQIILHASVSLRFYFLGNFLGNLLKFLFQAHKHHKVRLSVLLFALSSQSLLNSLQNYLASPIPEMGFGTDLQRN